MSGKPLHTPGPWAIAEWPDAKGNFIVRTDAPDAKPFVAALVPFPSGLPNARLIAAAPDMLAALRQLSGMLLPDDPRSATIRAAIAKAEG
jgi:hypothetical protein